MYVSDELTASIRLLDRAAGTVTTLTGSASEAVSRDGTLAAARFVAPGALALVGDTLFVADGETALRSINLTAGSVATVAGTSESAHVDGLRPTVRFTAIGALCSGPNSHLYIADSGRIRDWVQGADTVTTLVGGAAAPAPADGPWATATFARISGCAFDTKRNQIHVAENSRATIRSVDLGAQTVALLAGKGGERGPADGPALNARFSGPGGLLYAAGEDALYAVDGAGHTIRRVDLTGKTVATWLGDPTRNGGLPSGVRTPFATATLYFPAAPTFVGGNLAFASEGAVYLATPLRPILQ
jgi:hypothetical protein